MSNSTLAANHARRTRTFSTSDSATEIRSKMGSASTCTSRHASCALILLFCLALVDGRGLSSPNYRCLNPPSSGIPPSSGKDPSSSGIDPSSSATTDTSTVAVTSSRISELGQILINDGWRTKPAVMGMTADDCRNTIIHILTHWGSDYSVQDLQRMRNGELAQRYTTFKRMRDALVEGGYRTESQLRDMSEDDCRNTLIVVVFHSRQQQISIQDLQRKTNNELIEMLKA